MKKNGFTLIEMLAVVVIIGILASAVMAGAAHFQRAAKRARAEDLVKQAKVALEAVLLANDNNWTGYLIAGAQKGEPMLDYDASQSLVAYKAWPFSYRTKTVNGDTYYELLAKDRCGVVDPWAEEALKKVNINISGSSAMNKPVPTGGRVKDHVLRYALDLDGDGITEVRLQGGTLRIKASCAVWGCGEDGKFEPYARAATSDDVYSWNPGQVQK